MGMLRNIAWIFMVCSTKTCYHVSLKKALVLPISCYLNFTLQIIFWYIFAKSGGLTDNSEISKMIAVLLIIQSYQSERLKAYSTFLDMLFISFITDSNLQKRGINGICNSPQCLSVLFQCKVDWDDTTQTLVTARDSGGLWKVGTIFLECEKNMPIFYIPIPTRVVKMFWFGSEKANQFYIYFKF